MRVNALLDRIPLLQRNISHSDEQHEAVVNAILAGDPDAATAAMLTHVGGSSALRDFTTRRPSRRGRVSGSKSDSAETSEIPVRSALCVRSSAAGSQTFAVQGPCS